MPFSPTAAAQLCSASNVHQTSFILNIVVGRQIVDIVFAELVAEGWAVMLGLQEAEMSLCVGMPHEY